VAFTADGHVFVSSTEEAFIFFTGSTESETSGLFAELANSGQLLYFLTLRNKLEDGLPGLSVEGAA
jgi:hypothetical protein